MNQIASLFDEFRNNPKISDFFESMKDYINRVLEDPNIGLENVTMTQEFRDVVDKLENSMKSREVISKLEEFSKLSKEMISSIRHDTTSNEWMDSLTKFGRDFALDSHNKPSPMMIQDSLVQLKNLLIPLIKQQIISLKIPTIHKSNETMIFQSTACQFTWKIFSQVKFK